MSDPLLAVAEPAATPGRLAVLVQGRVQGVGFRPFVHRLATGLGLAGHVTNTPAGVRIEIEGPAGRIDTFLERLRREAPLRAAIEGLETEPLAPRGGRGFRIAASLVEGTGTALPAPDLATCDDCLRELLDPGDRRYRYPFVNCTQCGPRYSIVETLPYDRGRTTMRCFTMCRACRAEYGDPESRRFHAEPNACPACGPRLSLRDPRGRFLACEEAALQGAIDALREGRILAIKGIGGFHLAVDAGNAAAVRRLRLRKNRPDKPFAVMFPDMAALRTACSLGDAEEAALTGPARPILLLRRREGAPIAVEVAPENPLLGAFLPYSPLHHLLLRDCGFPLVTTSGNRSDEPIVTGEEEAVVRLGGIADLLLVHDRPIVRPVEDSVLRVIDGAPVLLRLGRGFAPLAVPLPGAEPGILALGGHLKAGIAVTLPERIVAGGHLGDLESAEAREVFGRETEALARLFRVSPRLVLHDRHPDYATSHMAGGFGAACTAVQHHLAHVAACMAEHGLAPPALGIAWDGTGFGGDGTVWGGEFLLVEERGWRRVAHLRRFPLPGGERAVREPRRAAFGLLHAAFGEGFVEDTDLPPVAAFTRAERRVLLRMLERGINSPRTSSIGRLFDAVASLCGLCQRASHEGQAACALEWAAEEAEAAAPYPFPLRPADGMLELDWQPALETLLAELRAGAPAGHIAARLHAGLAAAVAAVAERFGITQVVLSGGCFRNALLLRFTAARLRDAGFRPVCHRRVPPDDGSLALGQAAAVTRGWNREKEGCASPYRDA